MITTMTGIGATTTGTGAAMTAATTVGAMMAGGNRPRRAPGRLSVAAEVRACLSLWT